MHEWNRIFSDRNRRIAILCIPLVCLALFFYQKCNGNFGALVTDAQDYRALLETYNGKTPAEIAEALSEKWAPTLNEQRLREQAKHLQDYGDYLNRVQMQAYKMQSTSLFNSNRQSFVYRNILKTAEDFAVCSADDVCLGNDRTMQDWLAFSLADWGFLAAILLLAMSFLEKRQKGLNAIIRSCPAGREKLQLTRLGVLLGYSAGMTLLLYHLPLVLSMCLDGGWNGLFRPVQSLAEFRKCTAQMSILEFLVQFFFVKTACGFLLGVLICFLLSLLEQLRLCWLTAGLVIEYLFYTFIPAQSLFSPLRYINVFSYVFTTGLYTQYVNINFFSFPVGLRTLMLGLLAGSVVLLGAITVRVLSKRYPFGNRDWMGRWIRLWNRAGDAIRRHMGLYSFEWYKLLFLRIGGIFLLIGIFLTQNIRCSSSAYSTMDDAVYRQYVSQVQGPVSQSTFDYLSEARQALEDSYLDPTEFEAALDRLEQTIANLEDGAWIVDETKFMNVYGSKAWQLQRKNGLLALLLLVACLSPLYACEYSGDVRKVLRSTPGGRNRLFWVKYAVALSLTVLVWLLVFGREWQAAKKALGDTILSAPCSSIALLKGFSMPVRTFLSLLYLSKGLTLLITMHLCVFIGERGKGFEKAFLISGIALLLPAAAYRFGANAIQMATPLSFLADGNPLLSGSIVPFVLWLTMSILALSAAKRSWCRT